MFDDDANRRERELREIEMFGQRASSKRSLDRLKAEIRAFERGAVDWQFAPELVPSCADCDDTRFRVTIDERGRRVATPCPCRSRRNVQPVNVFDCPQHFLDARLSNFAVTLENAHAVEAAHECASSSGTRPHLYLHGRPGRGKSRLSVSIAWSRAGGGESAAFISVPQLIALAQRGIDDPKKRAEAADLEDRATETRVVVLDDVAGGGRGTDFGRDILTRIFDRRFSRSMSIIVTSNFDLPRLAKHYDDERLVSRIAEACRETFELGGPDRRLAPRPSSSTTSTSRKNMRLA